MRHEDKPFEWGVKMAAELGFTHVEPMVHWGRELLSEAGYFHSVSMLDDPLRIKRACEATGSSSPASRPTRPLCKPDISVDYLKQAIRFAAECGAPVINTDEGPKPPWTTIDEDHLLMRYTLQEAALVAEPRGILIGLEPHQQYSKHPGGAGPDLRPGEEPGHRHQFRHRQLLPLRPRSVCLARACRDRLVHLHAKDISAQQSDRERGKVTGTPVGCACGDGVIDWSRVVAICRKAPRDIVFSVECGTVDQAARSAKHLHALIR